MRAYLKKFMIWQCWSFATSVDIKFGRGLCSIASSFASSVDIRSERELDNVARSLPRTQPSPDDSLFEEIHGLALLVNPQQVWTRLHYLRNRLLDFMQAYFSKSIQDLLVHDFQETQRP